MKQIKLLDVAYVDGIPRNPSEGVLTVTNEEAERLVKQELAEDVTADFKGKPAGGAAST